MTTAAPRAAMPTELYDLLATTWIPHAVGAMARLGLAGELAHGPRSLDQVATATGADPTSLGRLVRALCAIGMVDDGDELTLTELGELLRSDTSESLVHVAR